MSLNLLDTLERLGREKGIDREFLVKTIELALQSASRKKLKNEDGDSQIFVEETENGLTAFIMKKVVKEVTNPFIQISSGEAKAQNPKIRVNQQMKVEVDPQLLGRNAAQTAKQVIIQRIQEAERESIYNEFKDCLLDMYTATVQRVEPRYAIVLIGRTEALLPFKEQPYGEKYFIGERVKVMVIEVRQATRGAQVVVSRSHAKLVTDLFTAEVPEISDGIIEIKDVAREAGERTKIAVYSNERNIDPVGACVGIRGQRVQSVVKELRGEKIDIISWSPDPVVFIRHSLSPAEISQVIINDKGKSAQVVVSDSQLSLAIGKKGQNVRLTAKLTKWKIDIIKEVDFKAQEKSKIDKIFAPQPKKGAVASELTKKLGEKLAEKLAAAGLNTSQEIIDLGNKGLMAINGLGPKKVAKILAAVSESD